MKRAALPRLATAVLAAVAAALPLRAQAKGSPAGDGDGGGLAWNQWRGAKRDGLSPDTGLLKRWPRGGPPLVWKAEGLGEGFSSVSFAGERIFTMGDVEGGARLLALRARDGGIEWTARVGPPGGTRNPGPRSTPSTDGELVFGLGHEGSLVCVKAATGEVVWRKNLRSDLRGRMMSGWGYSESPLLDGDLLVCTPGGPAGTVVALRKGTGEVVWRCTELTDAAAYCSLVPIELGGVRQYIVLTGESVAGVAAEDGDLLWRARRPGRTAVCSTPVYSDGWVFVASAYRVGSNVFRVTAEDGQFDVKEVWAGRKLESHHGGMVLVGGHVYGLGRRNLECIDLETGEVVWEEHSVGKGSIAYADGHLIVRSERSPGTMALVEATPDGYRENGRFDQPDLSGEPTWAHPVVFGGRLYVRDQDVLLCYDVRAQ